MQTPGFFISRKKTTKRVLDSAFQDGITRSLSVLENSFADKLLVLSFGHTDQMPG